MIGVMMLGPIIILLYVGVPVYVIGHFAFGWSVSGETVGIAVLVAILVGPVWFKLFQWMWERAEGNMHTAASRIPDTGRRTRLQRLRMHLGVARGRDDPARPEAAIVALRSRVADAVSSEDEDAMLDDAAERVKLLAPMMALSEGRWYWAHGEPGGATAGWLTPDGGGGDPVIALFTRRRFALGFRPERAARLCYFEFILAAAMRLAEEDDRDVTAPLVLVNPQASPSCHLSTLDVIGLREIVAEDRRVALEAAIDGLRPRRPR